MNTPHLISKPELLTPVEVKDHLHLVNSFSDIFSYHSRSNIDYFIQSIRLSPQNRSEETQQFTEAYVAQILERNDQSYLSGASEINIIYELLKKYPTICAKIIAHDDRKEVEKLDEKTSKALLLTGYNEYIKREYADQISFDGTKHYQIFTNAHGDMTLNAYQFDKQKNTEQKENKINIPNIDTLSLERIRVYQQTNSLMKAWCYFYRKTGGSASVLKTYVDQLEKLPVDESLEKKNFRLLIDDIENILEDGIGFYDLSKNYEITDMYLYCGPWNGHHPQALIHQNHTLVFVLPDINGSIQFGTMEGAPRYQKIFEIPKEDALGVLDLLCHIHSKSEFANRKILEIFAHEYFKISSEKK